MRAQRIAVLAATALAVTLVAGCRIEKTDHGDSKHVNIQTPFGGMEVKTDDASVLEKIGLPAYPGAQAVNDDGNDHRFADVDLSFGSFRLRVLVAKYRSTDPPDKVEAFYRNGLRRYGDVIGCRDGHPTDAKGQTAEGLTCDAHKGAHLKTENHPGEHTLQLKTGSDKHQHIVEIEPDGGGTKIGLLALDLPTDNNDGEQGDRQ